MRYANLIKNVFKERNLYKTYMEVIQPQVTDVNPVRASLQSLISSEEQKISQPKEQPLPPKEEIKEKVEEVKAQEPVEPVVEEKPEEPKKDKTIPYARFKSEREKVKELNKQIKELLSAKKGETKETPQQVVQAALQEGSQEVPNFDKAVETVRQIIRQEVTPWRHEVTSQLQLQETMSKYPDFGQYVGSMKDVIAENPNISFEQAYKIAKFEDMQEAAFAKGKDEAYQDIEKKMSSRVESGRKVPGTGQPKSNYGTIEAMLRDGKIPLSEIKKMLPHER